MYVLSTELCQDILSSHLINHPPSTLSDLVDCYNSTLSQLLNKNVSFKSKIIRNKSRNPWYTQALKKLELTKRHLERISGLVLIYLKIKTCALPLNIIMMPL